MMKPSPARARAVRARAQRGIAMIEALIAVLILSIGLIGTLGLQFNSQKALNEAGMRAEATIAANELIGVMNTDLDNLDAYALEEDGEPGEELEAWHAAVLANLPNASVTVTVTPQADTERTAVAIDISWKREADGETNHHRILTYLSRSA